jgi:RNA polymerase sigma-70 factor (ECF subfamily)
MTERSDAELIEDFKRGSETGFNELVRRYQERVYWIARRFLPNHNDADDVVQETFVKVYEALGSFRSDSSFYTWLYRIAVNASLNALRRKRIRKQLHLDDLLEEPAATQERPDVAVERSEERRLIDEAVAQLPEKQKRVFVLRYFEQLSYEEISKIVHTSVGGLKANYFHAIRKIENYVRRHSS